MISAGKATESLVPSFLPSFIQDLRCAEHRAPCTGAELNRADLSGCDRGRRVHNASKITIGPFTGSLSTPRC